MWTLGVKSSRVINSEADFLHICNIHHMFKKDMVDMVDMVDMMIDVVGVVKGPSKSSSPS